MTDNGENNKTQIDIIHIININAHGHTRRMPSIFSFPSFTELRLLRIDRRNVPSSSNTNKFRRFASSCSNPSNVSAVLEISTRSSTIDIPSQETIYGKKVRVSFSLCARRFFCLALNLFCSLLLLFTLLAWLFVFIARVRLPSICDALFLCWAEKKNGKR